MYKVFQLSTPTCPPCNALRKMMDKEVVINPSIDYQYIDITDQDATIDAMVKSIMTEAFTNKGLKYVPVLAIINTETHEYEYIDTVDIRKFREEDGILDTILKYFPEEDVLV